MCSAQQRRVNLLRQEHGPLRGCSCVQAACLNQAVRALQSKLYGRCESEVHDLRLKNVFNFWMTLRWREIYSRKAPLSSEVQP